MCSCGRTLRSFYSLIPLTDAFKPLSPERGLRQRVTDRFTGHIMRSFSGYAEEAITRTDNRLRDKVFWVNSSFWRVFLPSSRTSLKPRAKFASCLKSTKKFKVNRLRSLVSLRHRSLPRFIQSPTVHVQKNGPVWKRRYLTTTVPLSFEEFSAGFSGS